MRVPGTMTRGLLNADPASDIPAKDRTRSMYLGA
jgi:hypothetical protein